MVECVLLAGSSQHSRTKAAAVAGEGYVEGFQRLEGIFSQYIAGSGFCQVFFVEGFCFRFSLLFLEFRWTGR